MDKTSPSNALLPPSIDWTCSNKDLTTRLVQEIRENPQIREILWHRRFEPRTSLAQRGTAAEVLARALFSREMLVAGNFKFYSAAVAERADCLRFKFYHLRSELKDGNRVNWDMASVRGTPKARVWERVLRKCPYFRTLAFFNGDIAESEIEESVLNAAPLTAVSSKSPSTRKGPEVLLSEPGSSRHAIITHISPTAVESGVDEGEIEDLGDEDELWNDQEQDKLAEVEGEAMDLVKGSGIFSVRPNSASISATSPSTGDHSDRQALQPDEKHQESSPGIVLATAEVGIQREKMRLDYKLRIKRLKMKEKVSKRKLRVAEKKVEGRKRERDEAREHEKFMINNKIRLAEIENGIHKRGRLPKTKI